MTAPPKWLHSIAFQHFVKDHAYFAWHLFCEHFQQIMTSHPLPRRWRLRHNDRVRLLCDASSFVAALARLDKPQGSFLTFSQAG